MASILHEYSSKQWGLIEFQEELLRLIKRYNDYTGRYLFIYASDINKTGIRGVSPVLVQDDFYVIQDLLRESQEKIIDFYIETPGGRGEAAEEIARFLRNKFDEVNFVIAGEAKSAGTILVLSGDNIRMTDTGSLGPIDAQVVIGRGQVSAHDYKEWVDQKRAEAQASGTLNPFDAVMVAQISPGELSGVINSLEFAKDLVKNWLEHYKFKNWTETRSKKIEVTQQMKSDRAQTLADKFCNHTTWRTHGRSLKIEDLKEDLIIERIDDDVELSDIVYRIKTVIRMMFDESTVYKIYYVADTKISKTYSVSQGGNFPGGAPINLPSGSAAPHGGPIKKNVEIAKVTVQCPKCSKKHVVDAYLDLTSNEIRDLKLPVLANLRSNGILICDSCGMSLDLKPVKNQIESETKKKVNFN